MNTNLNQASDNAGEYKIVEKENGTFQLFYSEELASGISNYIVWKVISSHKYEDLAKASMIDHSLSKLGEITKNITKFNMRGEYVPYDL